MYEGVLYATYVLFGLDYMVSVSIANSVVGIEEQVFTRLALNLLQCDRLFSSRSLLLN
jgi:hypothetical protein